MFAAKQLLLILAVCYLVMVLFLYFQQKQFIFFPSTSKHRLEAPDVIDFTLKREDANLHGWLLNHRYSAEQILIYYGGNAEDIFFSIDEFRQYKDTAILLVNYRGYGTSAGTPSEKGFFSDALAVFDEVREVYSPQKIILMGRSLGSGVASYVAAHREIDGLILITPFDSIESLAKRHYPYVPVSLLLQHKFRSVDYIAKVKAPILIIYGGKDRTVPPAHTEKLIEKIHGQKSIVFIEEAEHNNIEMFDSYNLAILQFL